MEYMRALRGLSREVSTLIRERVFPLLEQQRHDAGKPVPTQVTRVIEGLRIEIADRVTARAPGVAAKMVAGTAGASRKALNDSYEKVTGLRPWENDDSL